MIGALNIAMLEEIGYSRAMVEKCPSLFSRNGHKKFLEWLSTIGVTTAKYINPYGRKYYGCFWLSPKIAQADSKAGHNARPA